MLPGISALSSQTVTATPPSPLLSARCGAMVGLPDGKWGDRVKTDIKATLTGAS
jgi:hypothetical protein